MIFEETVEDQKRIYRIDLTLYGHMEDVGVQNTRQNRGRLGNVKCLTASRRIRRKKTVTSRMIYNPWLMTVATERSRKPPKSCQEAR